MSLMPKCVARAIATTAFGALFAWPAQSFATAIQWNSPLSGVTHTDSSGTPLGSGWSFHLGAFLSPSVPSGWTPSPSNTDFWHQYWITADVSALYPANGPISNRFSSRHDVSGLIPQNTQAYIWGTNRSHPLAQWILLTDPGWLWPASDPLDATDTPFTFGPNTVAIVGNLPPVSGEMQSTLITDRLPPLLNGPHWQELHFSEDEIANQEEFLSGWMADPNNNGRPNILEFALQNNPRTPEPGEIPQADIVHITGEDYPILTVPRDPNADLEFTAEVSVDMVTWLDGPADVSLLSSTPAQLVFRSLQPCQAGGPAQFMRLRVDFP